MIESQGFRAVVRPTLKSWGDNPRSLSFEMRPPISVGDPEGMSDAISDSLGASGELVRLSPIIGNTTNDSTTGYLVRGYRNDITRGPAFNEAERIVLQHSAESALRQLVGGACEVEFNEEPLV